MDYIILIVHKHTMNCNWITDLIVINNELSTYFVPDTVLCAKDNLWDRHHYYFHFVNEEMKAQNDQMTHERWHSYLVVDLSTSR